VQTVPCPNYSLLHVGPNWFLRNTSLKSPGDLSLRLCIDFLLYKADASGL
jgi:hypothetical protein